VDAKDEATGSYMPFTLRGLFDCNSNRKFCTLCIILAMIAGGKLMMIASTVAKHATEFDAQIREIKTRIDSIEVLNKAQQTPPPTDKVMEFHKTEERRLNFNEFDDEPFIGTDPRTFGPSGRIGSQQPTLAPPIRELNKQTLNGSSNERSRKEAPAPRID
jgi:hypothetical protein